MVAWWVALCGSTTGALSADEETFNQFFDTYWMLQQAPTFKEALGAGADFSDASVVRN